MSLETFSPDPAPSPGTSVKPASALEASNFGSDHERRADRRIRSLRP